MLATVLSCARTCSASVTRLRRCARRAIPEGRGNLHVASVCGEASLEIRRAQVDRIEPRAAGGKQCPGGGLRQLGRCQAKEKRGLAGDSAYFRAHRL